MQFRERAFLFGS